jgi:hypothetical protein
MGKKKEKIKGISETETKTRKKMNNGRRRDFTRESSGGSVYFAIV